LRREVEAAGLEVLGWLPHDRMSSVYRRARVLVMPSRWQEPFGIAGLEAAAMGTPVAAWASGGVAEWHSGGGLLVPWGDVPALSQAIRRALAGTKMRVAPGFDADTQMHRLVGLYDAVRQGGGGPS
jgi:glycosyltransferase involved in cell wall biosynthesis